MAVNLSVKNVPAELAELLKQRAANNRRSLQRELLSILEAAVGRGPTARGAATTREVITVSELSEMSRKLFPRGTDSSVAYIRRMRDSR